MKLYPINKKFVATLGIILGLSLTPFFLGGCKPKDAEQKTSAVSSNVIASVELANPSEFERIDEPVYFTFYMLGLLDGDPVADQLAVRIGKTIVPSQAIDRSGNGKKDTLLALLNFKAGEKLTVEVIADAVAAQTSFPKRTQAEISRKTGGEWQERKYVGGEFENVQSLTPPPQHTDHSYFIRYEGPGIESDKVGYRVYLDWRNGFDIFGKKTSDMVLQNVGQDGFESYHHMADWGMDILKVGSALGVGGYGFWDGEKVERVSKVDGWDATIVENGDIYSAFQIKYKGWQIVDKKTEKKLDLTADLSMTAGSRLVNVRLEANNELSNYAIGIVKHPGTKLIEGTVDITGYAWTYVASYGKQSLSGDDHHLGMALLFRRGDRSAQVEDQHNYVSIMRSAENKLDYYFLAAWELEPNGITSEAEFVAYLEKEAERLTMPPRERMKTALSEAAKTFPVTSQSAFEWTRKLANSELERGNVLTYAYGGFDIMRKRPAFFEYTTGLLIQAYDDMARAGNPEYEQLAEQVIGSFVADDGTIHTYKASNFNIDSINSGKMILRLYEDTKEEKYKKAADHLRHQLENHPRTSEGAFWHKKIYPYQVWLDGVYMGMPFLVHHARLFDDEAGFEAAAKEAINEFVIARKYLRDPATGLYYHAWDEKKEQSWANPETGLSQHFWGRGMGWYAMALVDVLELIPEDKTELRQPLLDILAEIAPVLVKYQDAETGLWYQILDQPERIGNYLEASASSMFVYTLTKGVRLGYLPASYRDAALKGYEGLIREFVKVHADGKISLTNGCYVAGLGFGRDGSYRYYMSEQVASNDPKSTGPFIMTGVEVGKLLK